MLSAAPRTSWRKSPSVCRSRRTRRCTAVSRRGFLKRMRIESIHSRGLFVRRRVAASRGGAHGSARRDPDPFRESSGGLVENLGVRDLQGRPDDPAPRSRQVLTLAEERSDRDALRSRAVCALRRHAPSRGVPGEGRVAGRERPRRLPVQLRDALVAVARADPPVLALQPHLHEAEALRRGARRRIRAAPRTRSISTRSTRAKRRSATTSAR